MPIPALTFGESQAIECRSVNEIAESTRRVVPGLIEYGVLNPRQFFSRTSFAQIRRLAITAIGATPSYMRIREQDDAALIWSRSGQIQFKTNDHLLMTAPRHTAVYMPSTSSLKVESAKRSVVLVRVDPNRLESTTKTMLGKDSLVGHFNNPSEIALTLGAINFDVLFQSLFAQIDLYSDSQDALNNSGIDDMFYRILALTMTPKAFADQSEARTAPAADNQQLDRVCQYVMAKLGARITLTDLERIGEISRRTLHNSFMKTHGMSPMAWVREQRLLAAHAQLQNNDTGSIASVASSLGFAKASLFTAHYKSRFGELPSATVNDQRRSAKTN